MILGSDDEDRAVSQLLQVSFLRAKGNSEALRDTAEVLVLAGLLSIHFPCVGQFCFESVEAKEIVAHAFQPTGNKVPSGVVLHDY